MHRVLFLFLGTLVCVLASPIANAQNERRIEVIEAKGIIDGSVERARWPREPGLQARPTLSR